MQPTDKNHKSRKSLEKQPEAEAGIEFFASHAPCEAFLLQRLLGGASNEQAHEPRIWSMWYGAWVAVNTHTSSPLWCKWGETQNIKGDPASRVIFETLAHILPSLQSYASKVVSGPSQGITL